jgi:hypothetical protein
MTLPPNYHLVDMTPYKIRIRDVGPWSYHLTITQGAELVVEELGPMLRGRRLEYIDSEGRLAEIVIKDGQFAGFASVTEKG